MACLSIVIIRPAFLLIHVAHYVTKGKWKRKEGYPKFFVDKENKIG